MEWITSSKLCITQLIRTAISSFDTYSNETNMVGCGVTVLLCDLG